MLKSVRSAARATSELHRKRLRFHLVPTLAGCFRRPTYQAKWDERGHRSFTSTTLCRQVATVAVNSEPGSQDASPPSLDARERVKTLPRNCPGCGAPSQVVEADAAGFYGSARAAKASHMQKRGTRQDEDEIFANALKSGVFGSAVSQPEAEPLKTEQTPDVPICDRCHYLLYQSKGNSIIHPSMQSIQQIIEESPHKHNHIYHILDAADFPMSLIPNLATALHLPRLRTQNRRAKSIHYIRGRVAEISFVITRSDLLAPKKEQVDGLVPYLREVLRDALGKSGRNVRLGNVRCVSAKRGWWTPTVKEDVWSRGGAGWMVGKVNVGKSALYEVVFPKGRNQVEVDVNKIRSQEERKVLENGLAKLETHSAEPGEGTQQVLSERGDGLADLSDKPGEPHETTNTHSYSPDGFQESELETSSTYIEDEQDVFFDQDDDASLLPPAQPETAYPHMPLVSALPGTTASPIRIPFGNGKGELIDLPGVHRSSLDSHIKPEHRKELVMTSRVTPQQHTVKPGQSILLGGIIRITPKNEDLVFLAYPFVPLEPHVTSNERAIAIQGGVNSDGEAYSGTVDSIATETAKLNMKRAGSFQLQWDVTKRRTGPLTDHAAGKQKAANLPFIVYGADILIEGVGWVELSCQVRSRQKSFITETYRDAMGEGTMRREVPTVPEVEVWTPEGKFVAVRRPMNAWVLGGPKKVAKHKMRLRPRQSISFSKRKEGGAKGGGKLAVAGG